jgi:hypothetical protein
VSAIEEDGRCGGFSPQKPAFNVLHGKRPAKVAFWFETLWCFHGARDFLPDQLPVTPAQTVVGGFSSKQGVSPDPEMSQPSCLEAGLHRGTKRICLEKKNSVKKRAQAPSVTITKFRTFSF